MRIARECAAGLNFSPRCSGRQVLIGWLKRGRERRASVAAAADDLRAAHGDQARYEAILFAQLSREGKLFDPSRDAQFWWEVVLELDRRSGRRAAGL